MLCVPIVAGRTDGLGAGAQAERTVGVLAVEPVGLGDPDAVVVHARAALPRPRLGVDHAHAVPEREMAELLGIPFDEWMQVGLFPIAYTQGTDFAVTPREPAAKFLRWNDYSG